MTDFVKIEADFCEASAEIDADFIHKNDGTDADEKIKYEIEGNCKDHKDQSNYNIQNDNNILNDVNIQNDDGIKNAYDIQNTGNIGNSDIKPFSTKHKLTKYKGLHSTTQNSSNPYTCDSCQKVFKTNDNLLKHKIRIHDSENLLIDQSNIDNKSYDTVLDKTYACDNCKECFNTKLKLSKHKR